MKGFTPFVIRMLAAHKLERDHRATLSAKPLSDAEVQRRLTEKRDRLNGWTK